MPIDFNQMARNKVENLSRRLGTFLPQPQADGSMRYKIQGGPRHGDVLHSFHELQDFLRVTEYRSYEEFGPNALRPAGAGYQRYGMLEDTARKFTARLEGTTAKDKAFRKSFGIPEGATARITRESYGLTSETGWDAFMKALFVDPSDTTTPAMTGMPMRREGVGAILRLGYVLPDETIHNMRFDQLTAAQRNLLGYHGMINPKLDKRLSQYMSVNGMQVTKSDRLWNVSVMDRSKELDTEVDRMFAALTEQGGDSIGAQRFFREMGYHMPTAVPEMTPNEIQAMYADAKSRVAKLGDMMTESTGLVSFDVGHEMAQEARVEGQKLLDMVEGKQDWESMTIRKRGRKMIDKADEFAEELLAAKKAGTGVYGYGQFTGLRGTGIGGAEDFLGGQLKGHFLFVSPKQLRMAGAEKGADILTHKASMKKQMSFGLDAENSMRSAYFSRKRLKRVVELDVQSLTSFPELFPADRLIRNSKANFERIMSKNVSFGDAQQHVIEMAENVLKVNLEDLVSDVDKARLRASQSHAARIMELMKSGFDPRNEPELLHQLFEAHLASKTRVDKSGLIRPRFEVPDAWSSGFMTEEYMTKMGVGTGVKQGAVAFSPISGTWVTHEKTFASIVEATGGSDLDDIMVNLLRMDENGRLKAILFRNPNETAEMAALNIAPDDHFVAAILRSKGLFEKNPELDKQYKKAQKLRKQIASATDSMDIDVKRAQKVRRYQAELEHTHELMMAEIHKHVNVIERVNLSGIEAIRDATGKVIVGADGKRMVRRVGRRIPRIEPWAEMDEEGRLAGTSRRITYYKDLPSYHKASLPTDIDQKVAKKLEGTTRELEILRARQIQKAREAGVSSAEFPQYMNFRMVFNAQMHTPIPENLTADQTRTLETFAPIITDPETGERYLDKSYKLIRHETAIDAATDASGLMVAAEKGEEGALQYLDEVTSKPVKGKFFKYVKLQHVEREAIRQQLEEIAVKREAKIEDGFDPWLWDDKIKKNTALRKIMDEEFAALKKRRPQIDYQLTDLILPKGHPANIAEPLASGFKEHYLDWMAGPEAFDAEGNLLPKHLRGRLGGRMGELMGQVVGPDFMDRPEAHTYRASAQELLDLHKISRQRNRVSGVNVHESMAGLMDDVTIDHAATRADMLEHLSQWFEEVPGGKPGELVAGPQVYGRMLALQKMVHERGLGYNVLSMGHGEEVSVSELDIRARKWAMLQKADLDTKRRVLLEADLAEPITLTATKKMIGELRGHLGGSKGRTASDLLDVAAGVSGGKRGLFERGGMRHIKDFFEVKSNRYIGAVAGVAVGVGVVRSWARRKDRTPESLHGAPELPGGQPYLGPVGGGFSFGSTMDQPPGGGIVYDVRSRGGDGAFVDQAQAIVGARSVSGNIYPTRSLENPDRQRERTMAGVR